MVVVGEAYAQGHGDDVWVGLMAGAGPVPGAGGLM